MKKKIAFKARKFGIKGMFFTFLFFQRMCMSSYRQIRQWIREAVTDQGECKACKSLELTYNSGEIQDNIVIFTYICEKCGIKGIETYKLDFFNNKLIGEKNEYDKMRNMR